MSAQMAQQQRAAAALAQRLQAGTFLSPVSHILWMLDNVSVFCIFGHHNA